MKSNTMHQTSSIARAGDRSEQMSNDNDKQLPIPGIGQQKMTLCQWKKDNQIFTHHAPHMVESGSMSWTCWGGLESPSEFASLHGEQQMAFASSEEDAIQIYCSKHNISLPFWW